LFGWFFVCVVLSLNKLAAAKLRMAPFFPQSSKDNKQTSDRIGGESLQIFHLLSLWVLQNKIAQASQSLNLS
jgi:hypothetical protein